MGLLKIKGRLLELALANCFLSGYLRLETFVSCMYTAQQKHESTLLHTYVLNGFLTADRL